MIILLAIICALISLLFICADFTIKENEKPVVDKIEVIVLVDRVLDSIYVFETANLNIDNTSLFKK